MSTKIKREGLLSYDTLVHAASGAAGSIVAMSVFFPLDTIRSRLQVEDSRESKNTLAMIGELIKEEGMLSLYRGLGPVLTSICCSNFVYFYTFHGLRTSVSGEKSALRDLQLACLAGVINVLTTTPMWVVNTRLKMQGAKIKPEDKDKFRLYPHYRGIIDGLLKIAGTEGVSALWAGTMPSLLLVSNPAVQFMVYEFLKRRMETSNQKLTSITVFWMGAIAKCVSTVLTYPLQIIQSKLRYGSKELKKKSLLQMFVYILRHQGVQGLYKGLEAKLLQTVMTAALMFVCYEKIAAFVFQILRGSTKLSH